MNRRKEVRFTCTQGHAFTFRVPADKVQKVVFHCPYDREICGKEVKAR